MKVLGDNVLVEQTCTKKPKNLIIGNEKVENEDLYLIKPKVIGIGERVVNIGIDDIPVLASWAEPIAIKVISGKSGDDTIIRHVVYKSEYIVAIDNDTNSI